MSTKKTPEKTDGDLKYGDTLMVIASSNDPSVAALALLMHHGFDLSKSEMALRCKCSVGLLNRYIREFEAIYAPKFHRDNPARLP